MSKMTFSSSRSERIQRKEFVFELSAINGKIIKRRIVKISFIFGTSLFQNKIGINLPLDGWVRALKAL